MFALVPVFLCVALAAPQAPAPPDAPDAKPPTPAHTGLRAVVEGLKTDIAHLPSKENLSIAAIGGGLALAAHPFDPTVNARLVNQYDSINDLFAPAKYYGDTPEQVALSIGTWVLGRAMHKPKMSHLGMDLLRAQAVTAILVEPPRMPSPRMWPRRGCTTTVTI